MLTPQKLYDLAPLSVQEAMTMGAGYVRNATRYGRVYWRHRRWLESFDSWPLDRKLEFQNETLVDFLRYACDRSDYYAHLYRDTDLTPIKTQHDLQALPIVTKEDLRSSIASAHTIPRMGAVEGHTGGTTGKSLVVRFTKDDMMTRMAMLDHFKSRVGFEHRVMRRATFNAKHLVPPRKARPPFWRYNHACRQMLYSSFHLTDDRLGEYVASLNDFRPQALDGFFSSMVDVASYIERKGIELKFRPVGIFPTSETVTPEGRAVLERVFRSTVYNQYASSEGAPFITECAAGRLHVEISSGVFEWDKSGDLLVTSFTTHGTPLIRYEIGDRIEPTSQTGCSCGVQSPLVGGIAGRSADFLYRADGARINSGNVASLFKNMPNSLIRAQAQQTRLGEVRILLQVDAASYSAGAERQLLQDFEHTFGYDTKLVLQHVEEIPREASGKFRLIKNQVEVQR